MTNDGRGALIHKSSINIVSKDPHFPSPYFVFGEKVKNKIWYAINSYFCQWTACQVLINVCSYCLCSGLMTVAIILCKWQCLPPCMVCTQNVLLVITVDQNKSCISQAVDNGECC